MPAATTLKATRMERKIDFNGVALPDPGPEMTPEAIKTFYAGAGYADLANAAIEKTVRNGVEVISFKRAVGHKG